MGDIVSEKRYTEIAQPEKAASLLLQHAIAGCKERIAELEAEIEAEEDAIYEYQRILDRRNLAAYYAMHKELPALKVGDELLVTDEYNHYYNTEVARHWQLGSTYKAGTVVHVDSVHMDGDQPDYVSIKPFGGTTPMKIIYGMRRAYLAQQEEKQP